MKMLFVLERTCRPSGFITERAAILGRRLFPSTASSRNAGSDELPIVRYDIPRSAGALRRPGVQGRHSDRAAIRKGALGIVARRAGHGAVARQEAVEE